MLTTKHPNSAEHARDLFERAQKVIEILGPISCEERIVVMEMTGAYLNREAPKKAEKADPLMRAITAAFGTFITMMMTDLDQDVAAGAAPVDQGTPGSAPGAAEEPKAVRRTRTRKTSTEATEGTAVAAGEQLGLTEAGGGSAGEEGSAAAPGAGA